MTTMKNRERMRGYQAHNDLLDQVADSTEERDNVRRILTGLTERDLDAQEAWKCAPWPTTQHNHAHRHSRPACSLCESGLTQCVTPEACECADPPRPPMRSGDFLRLLGLALAGWAAVALVLVVMGVGL